MVWAFLSTEAYWGRWRDRATVEAQLDGAWRLIGAYDTDTGRMVGFARTVSDGAHIAYLADLFVVGDRRGEGIGHGLVTAMIDEGPGAHFRWLLHTADARPLPAARVRRARRQAARTPPATLTHAPGRSGRTGVQSAASPTRPRSPRIDRVSAPALSSRSSSAALSVAAA